MSSSPVVFLDQDGTLVERDSGQGEAQDLRLAAGVSSALRLLHANGYRVAIVAAGSAPLPETAEGGRHAAIERRVRATFAQLGVPLAGYFICRSGTDTEGRSRATGCDCQTPCHEHIGRAARELDADLRDCWLVGDSLDDVEAGTRAGVTTLLLDVGNEDEWRLTPWRIPDYLAHDLLEAAEVVLAVEEAALVMRQRRSRGRDLPGFHDASHSPDGTAPSEW